MTLDGTDWCQLVTLIAIPTVVSLASAVVYLYRALLRRTESHLKDLRGLARSAQQVRQSHLKVESAE